MSDQKAALVVPDEPAPPSQTLLGQKHQALPCIQTLERLIMNDSWSSSSTVAAAENDSSKSNAENNPDKTIDTVGSDENPLATGTPSSAVASTKINLSPNLDDLHHAIVTGYSLQGYVRMLNLDHARDVCDRLYGESDAALRKLWNYEGAVRFDEDEKEACVKIARLAAGRRMSPDVIARDGGAGNGNDKNKEDTTSHRQELDESSDSSSAAASVTSLVAYLSPCIPYRDLAKAISTETCIHVVHTAPAARFTSVTNATNEAPNNGGDSSSVDGRLDVEALTETLKNDAESGKGRRRTVLVIAVVGSPILGHNDYITKLIQLRQTYGFWLHLVGLNTAALAVQKPPEQLLRVMRSVDSVTLPLGRWLGLKALPVLTFVNSPDYAGSLQQREKMLCMPWWIVTNTLTTEGIQKRISTAFRTSSSILKHLLSHPRILLPSLGNATELLARIEKGTVVPPTVLTFKYTMMRPSTNKETGEATEEMVNDEYVDNLNLWLLEGLANTKPSVGLQLVDLSQCNLGAAIRYCPLEHPAATLKNPAEYAQAFGERLRSALNILDATVSARELLESVLPGKYPELRLMRTKAWAGVGDLVYLPAMYRSLSQLVDEKADHKDTGEAGSGQEWNDEQRRQISHFNIELVHKLRATDRAFAHGESCGLRCVRLGMLADVADLEPLVALVVKIGQEIEESSQYVDSLAEMVRRGIDAANEGLRRENDERLMQEGVLRQVPLVGSLMNWWSPVASDTKARGRTFDLKTGSILSTAELVSRSQASSTTNETASLTPHLSTASDAAAGSPAATPVSEGTETTESTKEHIPADSAASTATAASDAAK